MKSRFVSIIVPCYNASPFILKTIQSILNQTSVDFELIIINDGSSDNSDEVIKSLNDSRIQYYHQVNKGVSVARNYGLKFATGEYVVFFDSDDLMTDDFLKTRIESLNRKPEIDYVCGLVNKFNDEGMILGYYRGPDYEKLCIQILFYNSEIITCPSNFMFRYEFLMKNKLKFNKKLSSTADRYFLLECHKFGIGFFDVNISTLLYRINMTSMSNKMSKILVKDNEILYEELQNNDLIPKELRKQSFFYGYYMLSGANYKINNYYFAVKYGIKAFFLKPISFMSKVMSK